MCIPQQVVSAQSLLKPMKDSPNQTRRTCPKVQPWLYGYDSYKVADEAVQAHPFREEKEEFVIKVRPEEQMPSLQEVSAN